MSCAVTCSYHFKFRKQLKNNTFHKLVTYFVLLSRKIITQTMTSKTFSFPEHDTLSKIILLNLYNSEILRNICEKAAFNKVAVQLNDFQIG